MIENGWMDRSVSMDGWIEVIQGENKEPALLSPSRGLLERIS